MKILVRCPTSSAIPSLNDQTNIFQDNWTFCLFFLIFFQNYEQGHSIQTLIAQVDELNRKVVLNTQHFLSSPLPPQLH